MRVLVVEDDASVAKLFATVLQKAGHDVEVVEDGAGALQRVDEDQFDAVVCDWMLPSIDGTTVIRELRKRPGRQHAIVMTSCAVGPSVRAHAARAGADEFLAKPAAAAAIVSSVTAALEKRARMRAPVHPLAGTRAWRDLGTIVSDKLQESTGLEFGVGPAVTEQRHRASLSMLDVVRDTDVRIALFAQHEMGLAVTKAVVGMDAPSDACVVGVLAELCNNLCGAMKTAARADGYMFTLGLPTSDVPVAHELEQSLLLAKRCTFSYAGAGLEVIIGVMAAPVRTVTTAELSESMVLAEDVHTTSGLLVAAKGTRLTTLTAERVARHAPNRIVRICAFG
jgi:DNA-binding response OmpR family regulator